MRFIGLLSLGLVLASCGAGGDPAAVETTLDPDMVSFKSTDAALFSRPVTLTAKLTKPSGAGPFPAVVLVHSCAGIVPGGAESGWVSRLVEWGYVALQVDSFGPRRITDACTGDMSLGFIDMRVSDAYDGKRFLATLPFVDRGRIAIMGRSQGGRTVLQALHRDSEPPFRAAIAFYPWCDEGSLHDRNAPTLILIGDADDWTPVSLCQADMATAKTSPELALKTYKGAYHAFDRHGPDLWLDGYDGAYLTPHLLRYDPAAEADAVLQVKSFLDKYLK